MQPKVHSALISQLVSISLRKPLLFPRWVGSPSLSTETGPRRLFRPFTFDPCRPSSYFLDRHRAALSSRSSGGPLSLSLSSKLPSDAFSVLLFSLLSPRATRVSCPSLSSVSVFTGDFFRPRYLARSSPPRQLVFLLSHSGFRSVGLWGRKNERTNERTSERSDRRNWRGVSLSFPSFSRSRSVAARSFTCLLACSVVRPPSVSLTLRRFCIFIDCHLTSPTTGRPRSAAVPHPSRVPRFPRPCLILQQQQHRARYEKPLSVSLSCSLFALSRSLRFLSSPFLSRSFFLAISRSRSSIHTTSCFIRSFIRLLFHVLPLSAVSLSVSILLSPQPRGAFTSYARYKLVGRGRVFV